tara:strand:+ start:194 stop:502 length:309 start_codon:yes stop_codon:yes gene_type:complete
MKLFLGIVNSIIFFSVLITPFYTELLFLKTFLAYVFTFIWISIISIIGFKVLLSYFLLLFYVALVFIYFSNGFDTNVFIGLSSGILSSALLYFSRGMNLKNE